MNAIVLQPSVQAKQTPTFNKEVYVDFVAVQIKFLSFLAYIIRIFQDQVGGASLGIVYCVHVHIYIPRHLIVGTLRQKWLETPAL